MFAGHTVLEDVEERARTTCNQARKSASIQALDPRHPVARDPGRGADRPHRRGGAQLAAIQAEREQASAQGTAPVAA